MNIVILLLLFNIFINGTFIPNINKISIKEFNNYQQILEIQKIPCYMQNIRIKTFNSAFQKKNIFRLKTINEVNDLLAFRFVFYNRYDLLKFYQHLYNEKNIIFSANEIIDNNIKYDGMLLRYQNEYTECKIYQIECQLFIIHDFYKFLFNEDKNKIICKNLNFPYGNAF